jgi:heat shock protein HslJ
MFRRIVLFSLGLLVVACGSGKPIDQTLDETLWTLASIADIDIDVEPIASIGFGEGEVGGTSGCNTFGGAFRVVPDSDSISIGPLRSTLAACPSLELAGRERAMMAGLQAAVTYQVTETGLDLFGATGVILSSYVSLEPDLASSAWVVLGINTGNQSLRTVLTGTELTFEFDEASVSGLSGCNTFSGSYEASGEYRVVGGQSINFGPLRSTAAACLGPDGIMEQESQFHAALSNTRLWRLVGSNLELRDVDGSLQVSALPAK